MQDAQDSNRPNARWLAALRQCLGVHPLVMLVGPPSVGKTTAANGESVRRTGRECETLQCTPETELSHLYGSFSLRGDATIFEDGPLPRAYKSEGVFLAEEINLANTDIRAALLAVRNPSLTNPFTGERLPRPDSFRMICTSNNESVSKCRQHGEISRALLDDFLIIEIDPLGTDQVRGMLRSQFPAADHDLHDIVMREWGAIADLVSSKEHTAGVQLGYRQAQHLMKLLLGGVPLAEARTLALVNHFIADEDVFNSIKLHHAIGG